jgi:predicted nucleic acid-binding protein
MNLVVDTNVVFSALVKNSRTREMLVNPALKLYAPEQLFEELDEHRREIEEKAGITGEEFDRFLFGLKRVVEVVPKRAYEAYFPEARKVIGDPNDVPFAALAIYLSAAVGRDGDCGIWSNDKHFIEKEGIFFQEFGVKVWTTETLYDLMKL